MDENNADLLINTEETTTQAPAQQQEQQATKEKETKMSDVDLSEFSAEELQAALEKKKAEEANEKKTQAISELQQKQIKAIEARDTPKGFVPNPSDPSDLARWRKCMEKANPGAALIRLTRSNNVMSVSDVFGYPGSLTTFATLFDGDGEVTNDKSKVDHIRILSTYKGFTVDVGAFLSNDIKIALLKI